MAVTTLLAARLIDGTGAPAIHDAFLRIEDGRVTGVGRREDLGSAVAGARDLGDATLLPGLVNMHTHLTCSAGTAVLSDALHDSYETKVMRAVENARLSIESGVTTIRDCGTLNPIVFAIRDASRDGLIPGPHVWASGEVLTSTGGHCWFFGVECDSVDEVKTAVRRQVKAGADYIKVMQTGGRLTPNSNPRLNQFTHEQLRAITEDSARLGRLVAAHCLGIPGIEAAVDARVRTIEHCAFMEPDSNGAEVAYQPALAEAVAERGIYVCPTVGAGERNRQRLLANGELSAEQQRVRHLRLESLAGLMRAGVKIVSGNDAGMSLTGFDDFQLDLELLIEHLGMSSTEAVHTATGQAAEAIGSDEFGTLQAGRRADVLAVAGNAVNDIGALRNILLVLKSGAVMVDNRTAQASGRNRNIGLG
ncbi:MAG TPA: amidohydrolase family protein [Thermomicrobiales bacterium]|nr:amidohydrolase family protein [Thermomicrobiales bacterium]